MRRIAPFAQLLAMALLAPVARSEPPAASAAPESSLSAAPDAGAPRSALGPALRAIERGHYATAARALRKPAKQGDPMAQNNLGYYEHGLGVPRSLNDALVWYRKAAEGGLPAAQYNLGTFHYRGQGVAQDTELACKWFESAANAGYTDAEYMSGECLRNSARRDPALALSWFLKAARKGHVSAQLMAASIYLGGEGWRAEPQKALIWAELARINGEAQAAQVATRAGKGMRAEQLQGAMQQADLCLKTSYKDCPE